MQKDDIINKIVFEVSKQYSGSENIVKNILIRELYQYDLTMSRIGMVQRNFLLRLIILMGKCKHFSTEAVEKAHWFILETL